ncbi:hypothetical protein COO60DRAFT_561776 [Scenedesmus sp. NREL 46B-D3]|nr:hypothetical protein COO60DRAFT_561776 [Scenedesmus sp. NREL 46B-D3]
MGDQRCRCRLVPMYAATSCTIHMPLQQHQHHKCCYSCKQEQHNTTPARPAHTELSLYSQVICPWRAARHTIPSTHPSMPCMSCPAACNAPSICTQRPAVQLHHGVDSRTQHCAMPTHEAQQACVVPHELWRMGTTTHKEWGHTLTVFQLSSSTRATAAQRDQYVWLVSAPEAQTDTIRVHLRLPHHNSATSAPPPPPHQITQRHNSCCTAAAPPHSGLVSAVAVPLTQAHGSASRRSNVLPQTEGHVWLVSAVRSHS